MTDKTHDALLPDDEWEEYTIRIKKDPNWPHHGTDIEFNGVRYKREDLATPHAEAVRVMVEALEIAAGYAALVAYGVEKIPITKARAKSDCEIIGSALQHPAVVAAMEGK